MTIALEASQLATHTDSGGSPLVWSGSIVVPSGLSNSILIASGNVYSKATAMKLTDASGASLTQLGAGAQYTTGRNAQLFYLLAPTAGTYPVYVTSTSGNATGGLQLSLWSGVDQVTPFGTPATDITGGGGSLSCTSPTGGYVISIVGYTTIDIAPTKDAAFTLIATAGGDFNIGATAYRAASGTVASDWTSSDFAHMIVALQPASGGGTKGPPFLPGFSRPRFLNPRRRLL